MLFSFFGGEPLLEHELIGSMVGEDRDSLLVIGHVDHGIDVRKRDLILRRARTPDDECTQCEHRERCTHWCGCINSETTGDPGRVSPVVCWMQRCLMRAADRLANTLYEGKNRRFLRVFCGV